MDFLEWVGKSRVSNELSQNTPRGNRIIGRNRGDEVTTTIHHALALHIVPLHHHHDAES